MLRSMYSSIGGLKNFQTKLDVIGNNIANVNTFGYKKGRTTFQDMMSQQMRGASTPTANRGGTNPMQVGLGGTIATIDTVHTQGSMQTTGRSLDVAVSGDGFFVVNNGNFNSYTRAGNFYLDQNGTLVNGDGLRVMGYGLQAGTANQIDYTQIQPLRIQAGSQMAPEATTNISYKGNFNADLPPVGSEKGGTALVNNTNRLTQQQINDAMKSGFMITHKVVDSLGATHDVKLAFQKTATGEWTVGIVRPSIDLNTREHLKDPLTGQPFFTYERLTSTNTPFPGLTDDYIKFGSNGAIIQDNPNANNSNSMKEVNLTLNLNTRPLGPGDFNGAEDLQLTFDFSRFTQFSSPSTADVDQVSGNIDGFLDSFNIGQSGEIIGVYSNGRVQLLGQLALATFNNPGGLSKAGSNTYHASNNSGQPNIGVPGEGRGLLMGSSLEMSNVDISEEFTEMIVAQRGFQANTRIITTSDEILQELVNLKR
ncbi:flagellar basal-body rod protein FlgF [Alkalihalobacterium elongatum]|uniref:flagellar basal-body rod protein FlgF n=1 Tax=Alkalihalobacterium elongatum TaxID=2675466 RepID=UPI001C1F75A4|nr:flagellar basal-body rod protein FlgF [Alkalihalobacterium elongatum]